MNLIQTLKGWLMARQWKSFLSGQEAVAGEFDAWFTERAVAAERHGLEVILQAIDHANQLETQGERDEMKAACFAAHKAALVEMARARARVRASATPEEVSDALAAPFGGASNSATPSESGSKAIEHDGQATPPPDALPVRRGPGRPPGVKNRPKGE